LPRGPAPPSRDLPDEVAPVVASAPIASVATVVPPPEPAPATPSVDVQVTERPVREIAKKAPPVRETKASIALPAAPLSASPIAALPAKADTTEARVPPPPEEPVAADAVGPSPVTITGCLEISVDQDLFRLTDTEGEDAPRSRSWRTGFLKKRSAPVTLLEPPDPFALRKLVGHRVSATGVLASREMRLRSLRVVAPSCD